MALARNNKDRKSILVTRFSALGDIAMTIPLLYSLANTYKNHNIIFVSENKAGDMLMNCPENIVFIGVTLRASKQKTKTNTLKDYIDIFKLGCKLKKEYNITVLADLHNETKSHILIAPFIFSKTKIGMLNKEKALSKALTNPDNKNKQANKSIFKKYYEVFEKSGLPFEIRFTSLFGTKKGDIEEFSGILPNKGEDKWIGIAPFARHKGKIYPTEKMRAVIELLSKRQNIKIFCFGYGTSEKNIIDEWCNSFNNVFSFVGKSNFTGELRFMSHLDIMISMDSANMHLSSLVNVPVVSIWGATSPLTGFLGWKQKETDCIQLPLDCRPCSIYGNKPCRYGDYRCLNIPPERIVQHITDCLQK